MRPPAQPCIPPMPSQILITATTRLTTGSGGLSVSYESVGAPLIYNPCVITAVQYPCTVSLQKHADPRAISWRQPLIILIVPIIPIIPINAPACAAMHTADAITNLDNRPGTLDHRVRR